MQYKENEEIKDIDKEAVMNNLRHVMQAMRMLRDYLDQLDSSYHDKTDTDSLFRLYSALFYNDSVSTMLDIANSSLKSADSAYFYLANLENVDRKID